MRNNPEKRFNMKSGQLTTAKQILDAYSSGDIETIAYNDINKFRVHMQARIRLHECPFGIFWFEMPSNQGQTAYNVALWVGGQLHLCREPLHALDDGNWFLHHCKDHRNTCIYGFDGHDVDLGQFERTGQTSEHAPDVHVVRAISLMCFRSSLLH